MAREGRLGADVAQSLQSTAGNTLVVQMARDGVIQRAQLDNPEIEMDMASGQGTMMTGELATPLITMGGGGSGTVLPGQITIVNPQFTALDIESQRGLTTIRYDESGSGGPGAPAEQTEQAEQAE